MVCLPWESSAGGGGGDGGSEGDVRGGRSVEDELVRGQSQVEGQLGAVAITQVSK